jgi:hypothetical protein
VIAEDEARAGHHPARAGFKRSRRQLGATQCDRAPRARRVKSKDNVTERAISAVGSVTFYVKEYGDLTTSSLRAMLPPLIATYEARMLDEPCNDLGVNTLWPLIMRN